MRRVNSIYSQPSMIPRRLPSRRFDPMQLALIFVGFLVAVASAQQPTIRPFPEGAPIGAWVGGENDWQLLNHGNDRYTLHLFGLRTITHVQIVVMRASTVGLYPEHLGMRADLTRAPSPVPMPGEYPG